MDGLRRSHSLWELAEGCLNLGWSKIPREPNLWPPPPRLTHLPGSARNVVPLSYQESDVREQDNLQFSTGCLRIGLFGLLDSLCGDAVQKAGPR